MDKLNLCPRYRISETRNFNEGIFLNRAERTEPWDANIMEQLKNSIDFTKLGYYYDLADFHTKYAEHLNVTASQVLITNGADEALRIIYQIYTKEGSNIMYPCPTYGMYDVYTKLYKCNSILLHYDKNFNIDKKNYIMNWIT